VWSEASKDAQDLCSFVATAQVHLNTEPQSGEGSKQGQVVDVPFTMAPLNVNRIVQEVRENDFGFLDLCQAHMVPNSYWSTSDCAKDLVNQLEAWVRAKCEMPDYTPVADDGASCSFAVPGQTLPPLSVAKDALWRKILHGIILPQRHGGWQIYYDDVVHFVRDRYAAPIFVEIGTAYGGLADHVAGEIKNANVYAVDPFMADYDRKDPMSSLIADVAGNYSASSEEISKAWSLALAYEQESRHGCRYHQLHLKSVEGALNFPDKSVDVIFIDGLHTYEGVAADINAWLPKLKRLGGSLIFNDYSLFKGVTRAVDDFVRGHDLTLLIGDMAKPPGAFNAAVVF
jgi:hypothetical protein